MWAIDGGLKYNGLAVNGQYFFRWLNDFKADGPLPITVRGAGANPANRTAKASRDDVNSVGAQQFRNHGTRLLRGGGESADRGA